MEQNFSAKLKSNKGFYIGDLCYVLTDNDYYGEWNDDFNNFIGIHEIRGNKIAVGAVDGDGEYGDNEGHYYGVDAGNISVVPLELCNKISLEEMIKHGRVVTFKEIEVEIATEEIAISLENGRVIRIETGYGEQCDDEDEDDDY